MRHLLICCVLSVCLCSTPTLIQGQVFEGPYFGLIPNDKPQVMASGIISTALGEYNGTFSPDGREFFYTSEVAGKGHIVHMQMNASNQWSKPEIAPFSGIYSEYDPLFSPDGERLYFSSQRPLNASGSGDKTHIWFISRTDNEWTSPSALYLSDQGDYYSSITKTGKIYFNIWDTGDILTATKSDSGYTTEILPEIINGKTDVGDPFISPEEDYLIFRAYFNEGYGRGDLYITFKIKGEWTEPENLGEPINSQAHEICPYVTTDGKLFIFASERLLDYYPNDSLEDIQKKYQSYDNGNSNIYYMSADFIQKMKAKHVKD